MPAFDRIIPDRGEFIDTLRAMRAGHVMVKISEFSGGCCVNGFPVYHCFETLQQFALLEEFDNPEGFAQVRYFRLSPAGQEFADKAWKSWRAQPLTKRLMVRLTG